MQQSHLKAQLICKKQFLAIIEEGSMEFPISMARRVIAACSWWDLEPNK